MDPLNLTNPLSQMDGRRERHFADPLQWYRERFIDKIVTYDGFSLFQNLVVLAEGGQEDERGDVFKTVDPLPTLRLLTTDVHNPKKQRERKELKQARIKV